MRRKDDRAERWAKQYGQSARMRYSVEHWMILAFRAGCASERRKIHREEQKAAAAKREERRLAELRRLSQRTGGTHADTSF